MRDTTKLLPTTSKRNRRRSPTSPSMWNTEAFFLPLFVEVNTLQSNPFHPAKLIKKGQNEDKRMAIATHDLKRLRAFIAKHNPTTTKHISQTLKEKLLLLLDNSELGIESDELSGVRDYFPRS